ncbi:Wobble nucleotide-excising tRNase [Thermoanaerobacter uzonensis DSM 18761]|uniref:Nuclease SbcCD subunit C n=1 Tax=Thermoanaerobacter uzonensis DSM 18761 TaxID=1123369 RepID=A0A1M4ZVR2_9THEO|nr:AAA family ATPase [Thermoanaerobacter uzonensis]SHF22084.1 Wobble nucleotide-excising tRNase [Thermoanaerobacter uzonensis DSM 18761]
MIKRIKLIKNFGLFKDFRWSENISEFKKYNLIYGWNYSGKTTLARVFRNFEVQALPFDFNGSEFVLIDENGNEIDQNTLSSPPYHFRVFNVDFIKENLYWDSQEANPLFVLGEKDIRLEKKLEALKKDLEKLSNDKETKNNEIKKLTDEIEKNLTNKARELDRMKPPYDKRKFKKVLEEIKYDFKKFYLKESEVKNLYRMLSSDNKKSIPEVSINTITEEFTNRLIHALEKTVISQIIDRLKENPRLNNWIKEGLEIHKGKKRCEFCGGPLLEERLEQYEKHFSKEYDEFLKELNMLKNQIDNYRNQVLYLKLPSEDQFYPHLEDKYLEVKNKLATVLKDYTNSLDEIINLINKKINNPFEKIRNIPDLNIQIVQVNNIINKVNKLISEHNSISEMYKEEQEKAFKELERHYASEFVQNYNYFEQEEKIDQLKAKIIEIKDQIREKEKEIKGIEAELSDISKAAGRINNYLKSIFGKEHLIIQPIGREKFQILRNGEKAKNLSEGEKTAIAFSYFLTRLEDKETNISNTIVFIDDPISSLDSQHLYNTYALIASKLNDCNQLFISTHNLEFFNLIKDWMKRMREQGEKCRFYLVERITKNGEEISSLKNLPNTLLKYKSEYHFLFYKIKSFNDNLSTDFDSLYQLPNIVRRFLEAFMGFKYSKGIDQLEYLIDDESQRIMIDKFVNELSHQQSLQRSLIHNDLSVTKRVIEIVLNAVKTKDPEHYKTLEEIYNENK